MSVRVCGNYSWPLAPTFTAPAGTSLNLRYGSYHSQVIIIPSNLYCCPFIHVHTADFSLCLTHTYHPHEFGVLCRPSGLWMIPEVDISSHDRNHRITQFTMCSHSPTLTSLKPTISTLNLQFLPLKVTIYV